MNCPLCQTETSEALKISISDTEKKEGRAFQCKNCGLIFLEDYNEDRTKIYGSEYSVWAQSNEGFGQSIGEAKRQTFRRQLGYLTVQMDPQGKKLLDIGTGKGYLLETAKEIGFDCWGVEISEYAAKVAEKKFPGKIFNGVLEKAGFANSSFDVVAMTDVFEHIADPLSFFAELRRIVKHDGIVLIATPNADSLSRKILGKNWFQYKYEHVLYWNKKSIEFLFDRFGFEMLRAKNNYKWLSLEYYNQYFRRYPLLTGGKIFLFAYRFTPHFLRKKHLVNFLTGEMLVVAKLKK